MNRSRAAGLIAGLVLVGCRYDRGRDPTPDERLHAAVVEVRSAFDKGDLRQADDILARTRNRFPDHPVVRLWSAETALLRWQDRAALEDLRVVLRRSSAIPSVIDVVDPGEVRGRIGDLLMRMGRYGEARDYLRESEGGPNAERWHGLADLVDELPWIVAEPMLAVAELPLLEGDLPELICRVGERERPFVLDTGARFTTLTASLAEEVDVASIRPAGTGVDGMGREFALSLGVLRGFSLGGVDVGPQPVLVVANRVLALRDAFGGSSRPPKAVIGLDVLMRFRVTFDPGRRAVAFERRRGLSSDESFACLHSRGQLIVPVQVDGRRLWFALDTGATHTSLTAVGLALVPSGPERARDAFREVYTPGGVGQIVRQLASLSLQVGDGLFELRDVPIVARDRGGPFPVHGVLGVDVLRRCRLTIDSGRCRLTLLDR